ncbi:Putative chloride channel-like protein CLC-g [Seminavis robusta]|uniref:Chloride channel protein n=1 Tax=Seminavis robusta TaxID=568900 RepID=A0A9N8DP58_9STRA|nr:Putative chloride channel-like protein CLC-g [Seminavis robusta]|eukprot:Sro188_g081190.1 Putative chloride channel-like protein CLC-g (780) ;mRNA; r:43470-45894
MSSHAKNSFRRRTSSVREDCLGSSHSHHHHHEKNVDSMTFVDDESDVWRAHYALDHYQHRGNLFWNAGKHKTLIQYLLIGAVGVVQAIVAYGTNLTSAHIIEYKYTQVYGRLAESSGFVDVFLAYLFFTFYQLAFAMAASLFVWIEPVSAGSGIPEVKIFLNGIDLPRVVDPKTLVCKVLGVICSVSAGLPVGKEGPMVHSGAVVANTISKHETRDDKQVRDFVTCGAAAGVCTAFSSPIGGILFALEEGASYWAPSLTWKAFSCSMVALATLYCLNTVGSAFGKVGFNRLFSFGNFVFEEESSFAVFELALFVAIGAMGGIIGAVFNDTNERITKWRLKNVNHSKKRRVLEVLVVSVLVSTVSFLLPLLWRECKALPSTEGMDTSQLELRGSLVAFTCADDEYNEVASLILTDPGDAIRQLFHLHKHVFGSGALMLFFLSYISLAVVTYGIGVPSGLFVPSLLSGAAFGRLFGNMASAYFPQLAFSNTYSLIGAAAVLGGMARMTISLTVILLECIGNGQYVLPLMLTLMTAKTVGSFWNSDLYHIHIHFKKGVNFLQAELESVSRHHKLNAGHIMSDDVIFVRPVEKVSVVYDILKSSNHSNFPVVDDGLLYGTIGRNALCTLLKQRAYGKPIVVDEYSVTEHRDHRNHDSVRVHNYVTVEGGGGEDDEGEKFLPLTQWEVIEQSYPKYPSIGDVRISYADKDCMLDLRPFTNCAPISVRESASVTRTYEIFRSLGCRFLPVTNLHNQIVGTITRKDLTPDALAEKMIGKGARKAAH